MDREELKRDFVRYFREKDWDRAKKALPVLLLDMLSGEELSFPMLANTEETERFLSRWKGSIDAASRGSMTLAIAPGDDGQHFWIRAVSTGIPAADLDDQNAVGRWKRVVHQVMPYAHDERDSPETDC